MVEFIVLVPFDKDLKRVVVFGRDADEADLAIEVVIRVGKKEASKAAAARFGVDIPAEDWSVFAKLTIPDAVFTYYTCKTDLSAIPTGKASAVYSLDALKLEEDISSGMQFLELAKLHLRQGTPIIHMRIGE